MKKFTLFLFLFLGLTIPVFFVVAGTIDSVNKYAWSENIGWINFGCSPGCDVQITDTELTGYVWSQNFGWISLHCSNGGGACTPHWGVHNSNGTLSGDAWGENVGWINFTGVFINTSTGQFNGTATGSVTGDIQFNLATPQPGTPVTTNWTPGGIFCGDGICNGSENCSNCSADCGGCGEVWHYGCNAQQCISMPGLTTDECTSSNDCITHKACDAVSQQCVTVSGPGADTCTGTVAGECVIPITITHKACDAVSQKCISVAGSGANTCAADSECAVTPTHKACDAVSQKCISVAGSGTNTCTRDSECAVTVTHKACNEQRQCISVIGEGKDACQSNTDCAISTGAIHNECNEHKQCISVIGEGKDACQTSYNCLSIIEKIKGTIETPQGSVVTKAISTIGLAVAVIGVISSFRFFDLFLILLRSFGFLFTAIGWRKRVVPWGVVYDSVTKRPLDPVYVILKDLQGKTVSSAITDLDGRYGFLVEPGVYQMQMNKTNYSFPSQKLAGRTHDELYTDLYFGGNININKSGEVIIKNIPLDSLKFDWNEFVKKDKNLMRFYSKWDAVVRRFFDWLFVIGFVVAIIAFIFAPYPYNTIIMILYVLLLVLRIFGVKPRAYGYIADKMTNIPLSFAIMRVFLPDSQTVITSKVADKYGKYYCLVPPGRYYVTIEKKNNDGSYSLAYTSPVIDVSKKGIIKEKFKV